MTRYILDWSLKQPEIASSTPEEWKPAPTLLGGVEPRTLDTQIAAAGDLRCEGMRGGGGCSRGGSYGSTAMYEVEGRKICGPCAVRAIGATTLPHSEQMEMLRPFLLQGR
jgi:hypothetical protein